MTCPIGRRYDVWLHCQPCGQETGMKPDSRCQIRWEFDSPVIPLLNRIAPSDVIIVRSFARQGSSERGAGSQGGS